jgi:hypothetical protein
MPNQFLTPHSARCKCSVRSLLRITNTHIAKPNPQGEEQVLVLSVSGLRAGNAYFRHALDIEHTVHGVP